MDKIEFFNYIKSFSININDLIEILKRNNILVNGISYCNKKTKNISFIIETLNNKKLFIKCFENITSLNNEIAIYKKIKSFVRVPKMFFSIKSSNINFIVYEYIDDVSSLRFLEKKELINNELVFKLAIILATIHNLKNEINQKMNIPKFKDWYDIFLSNKYVLENIGITRKELLIKIKHKYQKEILEVENYISFSHCDFKSSNILIKNNDIIIIDWEFASLCYIFLDIAQLFRNKYLNQNKEFLDTFFKTYNEYSKYFLLPSNWLVFIKLVDIGNFLEMLSREKNNNIYKKQSILSKIDSYIQDLL